MKNKLNLILHNTSDSRYLRYFSVDLNIDIYVIITIIHSRFQGKNTKMKYDSIFDEIM